MSDKAASASKNAVLQLAFYWTVVGIPLVWGIWTTVIKLSALFQ